MAWLRAVVRWVSGFHSIRRLSHADATCQRDVNARGNQSSLVLLIALLIVISCYAPYRVIAAEIQYSYVWAGMTFATLSAAEAAMKGASTKHQFLEQTDEKFNSTTGLIEYNYSVPDRPAFQVGPTVYVGHNATCSPYCYSEADAYAAFKLQQETVLGHCNVSVKSTTSYLALA